MTDEKIYSIATKHLAKLHEGEYDGTIAMLEGAIKEAIESLELGLVDAGSMLHLTHGKHLEAWVNCTRPECKSIRDTLGEATARRLMP